MPTSLSKPGAAQAGGGPPPAALTPRIDSHELLRGGRLIEIFHVGQRYTLRLTRENKLILTK